MGRDRDGAGDGDGTDDAGARASPDDPVTLADLAIETTNIALREFYCPPSSQTGMDAEEIRTYSERYNDYYSDEHQEIEEEVGATLDEDGYLTRDEMADVLTWKLDNQPGRRDRYIGMMRSTPEGFVRRVTEAALLPKNPTIQLQTLSSIPGVGDATGTVVLAFYQPATYAVGDRYMVDALLGEDRGFRRSDYSDLLEELRERNPGEFDLRTIEKAYYRRYQEQHGIV